MTLASDIKGVTTKVTKKWTAQRKREERNSRARHSRRAYMYSDRVYINEVVRRLLPGVYSRVSDNGRLPAHARQLFYKIRRPVEEETRRPLRYPYFSQVLLPQYAEDTWWVVYDRRGQLSEPHTDQTVPLSTLDVDKYLTESRSHVAGNYSAPRLKIEYPTKGPENRVSAIFFIEKEGFNPLFAEVKLAERYDLAIMSSKGQSVVAARRIVDEFCEVGEGVPVLVLHDLDKAGLEIANALTTVTLAAEEAERVRYRFENEINVIDIGVRLADVEQWNLESEPCDFKGGFSPDSLATPEEQQFLRSGQRVEINSFASGDLIAFIEGKLAEHGVAKVIPERDTLEKAYRRAYRTCLINRRLEGIADEAEETARSAKLPKALAKRVNERLQEHPTMSWDKAVAEIANSRLPDEEE